MSPIVDEQRLDALFVPGCDPYLMGASVVFDKHVDAVTHDERDLVKRVFMRILAVRGAWLKGDSAEQALRRSSDMFHEIGAAFSAEKLSADPRNVRNTKIAASLREHMRSRDQLDRIAADGFELCVRALAAMGASDVTIHECGEGAIGETPWGAGDDA